VPINTEDEQGVNKRDQLFPLLRRVIGHTACHDKSWNQ